MRRQKVLGKLNNKVKCYFIYTILFMVMFYFIFSAFDLNEKGFAWGRDSFTVEYPARLLLRKLVIDFLKNPSTIPMFSFSIGQGLDILSFLNTWYLEPVNILMIFFPINDSETAFTVICILYLYLSGLSFFIYSNYIYKKSRACVIGSLIYCFSGFALYYAPRHPCFLAPMIYMPLIFLTIEKMIRQSKKYVFSFIVIIFVSLLSSYYYFYINTIFMVLYVFVRLLMNCSISHEQKKVDMGVLTVGYILGVGIACASFFPALYFYLNSNRKASLFQIKDYLIYEFPYYIREFIYMVIPYVHDYKYWLILGIAPICVITFFLLLLKSQSRELKLLCISGVIFVSFPLFGLVFAAFGSINSRFSYYLIFGFGIAFVAMYDSLYEINKKIQCISIVYIMIYLAISIFSSYIHKGASLIGFAMISLTVIAFLEAQNTYIKIRTRKMILDIIILITVSVNGYFLFNAGFTGYVNEFNDLGMINEKLLNSPLESVNAIEDNSFFRVAEAKKDTNTLNSSISAQNFQGVKSISLMHNVIDNYMAEFNLLLGNRDYYDRTMIYGLDNRKVLETLADVKYYIANEDQSSYIPDIYAFDCIDGENKIFRREPEYCVELGYLYERIMPYSEFEKLNMMERQEALVQCAIINDSLVNQNMLNQNSNTYWNEKADYVMFNMAGQEIQKDLGYTLSFQGEVIYMDFHVPVKSEIYLQFARASAGSSSYTAILNGLEKSINFLENDSMYDAGQETYLVYMGCVESGDYRMEVRCDSFVEEPMLTVEDMIIYTEPVNETNIHIKTLAEHQLQNVKIETNHISANINAENASMLFLSIPYTSKGWKARVDGEEVEIIRTNIMYMGIPVSNGEHKIELTYSTPYLRIGIIVSVISLLITIIAYILYKYYRH